MLLNIGGQLFALVPAQSLEAGPEFYNAGFAPHNCVGGSEQGCVPGAVEAGYLFKDPSKMNKQVCLFDLISELHSLRHYFLQGGLPKPSSWYHAEPAAFL